MLKSVTNTSHKQNVASAGNYTFSYDISLHGGANLKSFWAIPADNSVGNVLLSLGTNATGIIGEGEAASQITPGNWVGSLSSIKSTSGYWIKVDSDLINQNIGFNVLGFPYQEPAISYELHEGYNLISYIGLDNALLEEAIPEEFSEYITSIIGEGMASIYSPELQQWLGNLNELDFGSGYWIETNAPINFYWNGGAANTNFIIKKHY